MAINDNKNKKEIKSGEDRMPFKILFILFAIICFTTIIVLGSVSAMTLIKDSMIFDGTIKFILLSAVSLFVLYMVHQEWFYKAFEIVAFSKTLLGIPLGLIIITAFFYSSFDALLWRLFNIWDNTFLAIVNFIVSMIISFPLYLLLSAWYLGAKEIRQEKEEKKGA